MSEPRWSFPGLLKSRIIDGFKEWYVVLKYINQEDNYFWLKPGTEYIVSSGSYRLMKALKLKEGSPVMFLVGEYSSDCAYTTLQCPCCGDYNIRQQDYFNPDKNSPDLNIKR